MYFSLRRYVWVVDLIGIAIGAVLAGHATAIRVAALLPAPTPPPAFRARAPRGESVRATDKSIAAIVDRNVFCSTCSDVPAPQQTRRPLRLLAIMFARPPADPRWSVAVIRNEEAAVVGPFGVGARLGDATIDAIEEVRVVLDVGPGRHEILELLSGGPRWSPGEKGAKSSWPVACSTRSDGHHRSEDTTTCEDVRKIGARSYEVRRATIDRFLQGGVAPPWPRIVPQTREGQPNGLLLAGVGRDSVFAALGLASGDVLLEVNGRAIATPDAALAAYTALRTADHFSLVIEREGRRIRLDYVIR